MAQYGIGLSALNAFSEAIDVTSNNIANGQTVGYKQAEYVFADQFFKAQNPQSRDRAGMGTSRMIIRRANTYGTDFWYTEPPRSRNCRSWNVYVG